MLARQKHGLLTLIGKVHELLADPTGKNEIALVVQEDLLRRIGRSERRIRDLRAANKCAKRKLAVRSSGKDAARKLKAQYAANRERIDYQVQLLGIFRDIGDAIAFIYIDRWDIKPLIRKQTGGFVTGKRGTRLERAMLRQVFKLGATGLLNDLTHSLRFGDITVFLGNGRFGLIEVKSGKGGNRKRAKRQAEASQRVLRYLETDELEDPEADVHWRRQSPSKMAVYNITAINNLVSALPKDGWLSKEVERGLYYILIDGDCPVSIDQIPGPISDGRRLYVTFVNLFKREQSAYYPFLLSIQDAEAVYRFYNGEFIIIVVVDLDHVSETLASCGYALRLTDDDHYPWEIVRAEDDRTLRVGVHLLGRIGAEFLSLDWLMTHIFTGPLPRAFEVVAPESTVDSIVLGPNEPNSPDDA